MHAITGIYTLPAINQVVLIVSGTMNIVVILSSRCISRDISQIYTYIYVLVNFPYKSRLYTATGTLISGA